VARSYRELLVRQRL